MSQTLWCMTRVFWSRMAGAFQLGFNSKNWFMRSQLDWRREKHQNYDRWSLSIKFFANISIDCICCDFFCRDMFHFYSKTSFSWKKIQIRKVQFEQIGSGAFILKCCCMAFFFFLLLSIRNAGETWVHGQQWNWAHKWSFLLQLFKCQRIQWQLESLLSNALKHLGSASLAVMCTLALWLRRCVEFHTEAAAHLSIIDVNSHFLDSKFNNNNKKNALSSFVFIFRVQLSIYRQSNRPQTPVKCVIDCVDGLFSLRHIHVTSACWWRATCQWLRW